MRDRKIGSGAKVNERRNEGREGQKGRQCFGVTQRCPLKTYLDIKFPPES